MLMRLLEARWAAVSIAILVSLSAIALVSLAAARQPTSASVVDSRGNLRVPPRYKTRYESLGAWAVRTGAATPVAQMHLVYASPGTIEHYRATGRFANGTVLVKEVWDADTQAMTTGTVSHAGHLKGWFVLVRESRNLHPENKLWGDGWAWSWFDATNSTKTTSTDYTKDCKGCHVPARGTNWVYVNGYPALDARRH
jgi:hypothetical protein